MEKQGRLAEGAKNYRFKFRCITVKLAHSVLPTAVSLSLSQRYPEMSYDLQQGSPWCLEQGHRKGEQSEQHRGLRVNTSFQAQKLIPLAT